jgi:transcriptional regulator with XRE-family HTH domain
VAQIPGISEIIRQYRFDARISREQLARQFGVTPPSVCEYENGRSMPGAKVLLKLASLTKVPIEVLCNEIEATPSD